MIINNFDVFCESIQPTKADSPLIIDANAALTGTISLERLVGLMLQEQETLHNSTLHIDPKNLRFFPSTAIFI